MRSTGRILRMLFGIGRGSRASLGWLMVVEPT
jgi:hypothetical protein